MKYQKEPAAKNRRRRKLIVPELQIKMAIQSLFIALPILLLNFLLLYSDALAYQRTLPSPADAAVTEMLSIVFHDLLIIVAITVPFALGFGVLYSFPFCGPVYRMNKFLSEFAQGRWDRTCSLREGDHLHVLKDNLNNVLKILTGQISTQHDILREARTVLHDWSSFRDKEKVQELLDKIDAEQAKVERRLGAAEDRETAAQREGESQAVTASP